LRRLIEPYESVPNHLYSPNEFRDLKIMRWLISNMLCSLSSHLACILILWLNLVLIEGIAMGQSDPFPMEPLTQAEAEKSLAKFYRPKEKVLEAWGLLEPHLDLAFNYPETEILQMFGVCGTTISDDGMARLAQLRHVKEINIHEAYQIRGTGFAAWTDHPALTVLWAMSAPIDDEGLAEIGRIKKLQQLTIAYTKVTDAGMDSVVKLQALKALNISGNQITDVGVRKICNSLPLLEELAIEKLPITPQVIQEIGKLKNLRRLEIGRMELSKEFLIELGKLEHIEELSLRQAEVDVSALAELSNLKRLRWLRLTGVDLKGADLSWLKHLSDIEILHLDGENITDEELETMEITGPLRFLNLLSANITDKSIQKLEPLHLKKLGLSSGNLTEAGLENLIKMQSLDELYIGADRKDEERLKAAMPNTLIHDNVFSFYSDR
jgi:Leucine-rich repeat (LRR) protein